MLANSATAEEVVTSRVRGGFPARREETWAWINEKGGGVSDKDKDKYKYITSKGGISHKKGRNMGAI